MIAIGILGVGMLMVATTFPIGIEQTRRITNDTMAPMIAGEAFSMLERLIRDPKTHVIVDPTGTTPVEMPLRDSLFSPPAWPTNQMLLLPAGLTNLGTVAAPVYFDLNLWLLNQPEIRTTTNPKYVQAINAPSPVPYDPTFYTSNSRYAPTPQPLVAAYPSRIPPASATPSAWPPSLSSYPYYWCMLYLYPYNLSAMGTNPVPPPELEVAVFVNRRNQVAVAQNGQVAGLPVWFQIAMGPGGNAWVIQDMPNTSPYVGMTAQQIAARLDPGLTLASSRQTNNFKWSIATSKIREIVIDTPGEPGLPSLVDDNGNVMGPGTYWTIWRDSTTGTSPNIGVFTRTIQID